MRRCVTLQRCRSMIDLPTMKRYLAAAMAAIALAPALTGAQATAPVDSIVALLPPKTPLPTEAATARTTKFSFIAYGDTRGRHDGTQLQSEHTLVIESMLATIKKASTTTMR